MSPSPGIYKAPPFVSTMKSLEVTEARLSNALCQKSKQLIVYVQQLEICVEKPHNHIGFLKTTQPTAVLLHVDCLVTVLSFVSPFACAYRYGALASARLWLKMFSRPCSAVDHIQPLCMRCKSP